VEKQRRDQGDESDRARQGARSGREATGDRE